MPHARLRYAEPIVKQLLAHSPIVGVLGQRQTGKTTLTESISKEYASLDLHTTLEEAEHDPMTFLEKRSSPFTIDECQMVPKLFPALKEKVRRHPQKGQFILTGSIRFTSRRAIRESLTGRIVNLELLPFSLAESHSEPLPQSAVRWMRMRSFAEVSTFSNRWLQSTKERFQQFLETGGLPGICFFREKQVRAPRFETHLETLLERDIRLLVNTPIGFRQLRLLCALLAIQQGLPLNYSELGRKVGVSAPSIRKLIAAMEAMFLIRTVSTDNQVSPVVFFEDQGIATHLAAEQKDPHQDLVRGIFSCLLPQFLYRSELVPIFSQYRTRGGAKVDIVVRTDVGILGIIPVIENEETPSSVASARSFLASIAGAKVIIAHQGSHQTRISESILSIPFPALVSDAWVR